MIKSKSFIKKIHGAVFGEVHFSFLFRWRKKKQPIEKLEAFLLSKSTAELDEMIKILKGGEITCQQHNNH